MILPYINTLAALGNSASLRYLVPIGGHAIDLLHADDELVLGYASGHEEFPPLNGGPIEHPLPGEIIFYVTSPSRCSAAGDDAPLDVAAGRLHEVAAHHHRRRDQRRRLAARHPR